MSKFRVLCLFSNLVVYFFTLKLIIFIIESFIIILVYLYFAWTPYLMINLLLLDNEMLQITASDLVPFVSSTVIIGFQVKPKHSAHQNVDEMTNPFARLKNINTSCWNYSSILQNWIF